MKIKTVKKKDWIINKTIIGAEPWYVCGKYAGMVIMRRAPKIGRIISLTTRQLCNFRKLDFKTEYTIKELFNA